MKVLSHDIKKHPDGPKQVSDDLLSEDMAQHNHYQSLKRLNERGGMSYAEIYCNIQSLPLSWIRTYSNLDWCLKVEHIISMQNK